MCYNVSLQHEIEYLKARFDAQFTEPDRSGPVYHVSGFQTPHHPVITNTARDIIQFFKWGLVPFWVKDKKAADQIKIRTLNARSETIFQKPAFRAAISSRRCLVLVDGFYEWHHKDDKKYPYYIRLKNREAFSLAGIWEQWTNPGTSELLNTFSIITTQANSLLEKIHNSKKRMPVIIARDREQQWLDPELSKEDIGTYFAPFDHKQMEAHSVSKLIAHKNRDSNLPEAMTPYTYPEL